MRTTLAATLAGLVLAGQCLAEPTAEQRYAQAVAVLVHGCRGTGCDFRVETAEEQAALDAARAATQNWTMDFLDHHHGLTGEKLKTELLNRQNGVAPVAVLPLSPGLYAVFAQYGEMGNVFLVADHDGRFAVVWDIRDADPTGFPILKAWRSDQDNEACWKAQDSWKGLCGPLYGNAIQPLPPDDQGRPRFALTATYAQAAETTVGGQLSVWSLDGTTPRLQWAKHYAYNFEDVSWKRDRDLLKIRATEWWHTLFACGTCVGRQMDWTLRIRPDGIDDLGMTPVVSELDAFDELAWRVFKRQRADNLATPEVLASLKLLVTAQDDEAERLAGENHDPVDPNWFSFGMLMGYSVRTVTGGSELCVNTDNTGFRIRFVRHGERLFAVELMQLSESDIQFCSKPAP
jgi:hypothetical protein